MNNNYTENAIVNNTLFGVIKNNVNDNFGYIAEVFNDVASNIAASIRFGVYTGNDDSEREINLGAKPKAVVVYTSDGQQDIFDGRQIRGGLAIDGNPLGGSITPAMEITNNRFKVYNNGYTRVMNDTGEHYYYIAFMVGTIDNS